MCHCKHRLKEHEYDKELEAYMECKTCDCEGFDLAEETDAKELEF